MMLKRCRQTLACLLGKWGRIAALEEELAVIRAERAKVVDVGPVLREVASLVEDYPRIARQLIESLELVRRLECEVGALAGAIVEHELAGFGPEGWER